MTLVNAETGEVFSRAGLDRLTEAEQMLAEIASAEDAMKVIDFAEAARVYAERAGLGIRSANYATTIKVCAEIKLAEVVKQGQEQGRIAKRGSAKGRTSKVVPNDLRTLDQIGIKKQRLSEARKMAKKYTPEKIRSLAKECNAQETALSRRQLLNGEAIQQSKTNEWYTPAKYLDAARAVLGEIDLDPATCDEANGTVKAIRIFTEDDDGLARPWHGRVWLNPPYGRIAGDFIAYLAKQHIAGNITAAIALVNAHCTDTQWFQVLWDHTLCFTDHRIDFAAGTEDRSGSTHGSVFVYFGPDAKCFAEVFAEFGTVIRRWP